MLKEITVEQLHQKLQNKESFQFIDVREKDEYDFAKIEGATLIPLSQFQERFQEIDPDQEVVICCHHGGRSMRACEFLLSQGYTDLINVKGGIDQWSLKINPKVPRY